MSITKYYNFAKKELFNLNRSITGEGTKKTLKLIKKKISNFRIKSFPSGKKVFDWKIPYEWNVKNAYVIDKFKKKIIDFKKNNLHLVGYSEPISKKINKKNLFKKLYSLPNKPKAIPYITSYYKKDWGFCIDDQNKKRMDRIYKKNDLFFVKIDSNFNKKGKLNYGELFLPGKSKKEILISTYICHPSMANNELSGPILSMCLINFLSKRKNNKSYRFIFIPETIGSISYLAKNFNNLKKKVEAGFNLTCVGDERMYSCILSKYGNSPSDFALLKSFKKNKINFKKYPFILNGSDERQYNSPNIDLPITSFFKSKFGTYPEYHTSLDNFDIVTEKGIKESFNIIKDALKILDNTIFPKSLVFCEPFMSKRGLYPTISKNFTSGITRNIMNFIQYSDGHNTIKNISKIIGINENEGHKIYKILKKHKILN